MRLPLVLAAAPATSRYVVAWFNLTAIVGPIYTSVVAQYADRLRS